MVIEEKLDYDDVLLVPKNSRSLSRSEVNLLRDFRFYWSDKQARVFPIIASNMDTTGTFAMAETFEKYKALTCLKKFYSAEEIIAQDPYNVFYTMGIQRADFDKLHKVIELRGLEPSLICIDVANGYTDVFLDAVKAVREICPKAIIMAGNVCTAGITRELIKHCGADIVKVGIGPGSVCTTRLVAGVGYPQFSAVMECAEAAHGLFSGERRKGLVCADGGCKTPGDVAKAFGAGADFVMLGGMLAGTDECDGDWQYEWAVKTGEYTHYQPLESPFNPEDKRKKSLKFYGMSSYEAQDKYNGGQQPHRASEGKVVEVPYKGSAADVLHSIEGGLRSASAYIGSPKLEYFHKCATFVRVNRTHNTVFGNDWQT